MQSMMDLFKMGSAEQGLEQQQMTGDYQKWLQNQWYNNPALDFLPMALGTQANVMTNQRGAIPGVVDAGVGLANIVGTFL
jgi:hypothetical protein